MELSELLGDSYHDGMTLEEVNSALAGVEMPNASEINKLKASLSKTNSEAASYKKQLKAMQSSTKAEVDAKQSEYEQLSNEFSELKKQLDISTKTSQFMKNGYSEDLANKAALAMVDGDFDTFMEVQNQFISSRDKEREANALRNTPRPTSGSTLSGNVTKDDFRKMGYKEKVELRQKDPSLYEELTR